ncbi:putative tetrahydrofolate synthase KNAG_0A06220 [Huiozyma naganishii CBS 8797]|uniref:Dihydrofolate synthetase n=1 Tax=Huiozyma naganishii (strain ATCC MYA-139 / BCRC 22969 / CBS 8797 / KCTC 17520 / NBRC 10181 / NCYC 3082 / Yp74L-3) TaxID=1071383 RepID=J7RFF4_HUIN7|nr:hypothetical protein KNAG_0A06220 [Kazachstania naganishii CBS 8797]CCK68283.1 hypothetical protein KNAG_0A06220 [Kazachstania naganishii CBS 8797]
MSIELGLSRISKLLSHLGNPQDSLSVLHIAGTNGKGSVCSYLSALLHCQKAGNTVGRFTTPHLIHVTDSITVNNVPIPLLEFNTLKASLDGVNKANAIQCSEFELLTCLALSYFKKRECNWCVLEVGLGGRLDATNVIPGRRKLACGITKIGLDHESFLGNTLPQIAREKAGIVTEGTKYTVVDGSNDSSVFEVVKEQCAKVGRDVFVLPIRVVQRKISRLRHGGDVLITQLPLNGEYQICNLRVALGILDHLQQISVISLEKHDLLKGLQSIVWPGRLQELDFCYSHGKTIPILMDGAHNGSAAVELAKFIKLRYQDRPVTFVMAVTAGKKLDPLLDPLLRKNDTVVVTKFGAVDGMPWVRANDPEGLAQFIREKYTENVKVQPDVHKLLIQLADDTSEQPVVVCGSLYLCGQLLAMHNSNMQ